MTAQEHLLVRTYPAVYDAYHALAADHADLLMAHAELEERFAILKGFTTQALRRAVASETRLAQVMGLEPWHVDPS